MEVSMKKINNKMLILLIILAVGMFIPNKVYAIELYDVYLDEEWDDEYDDEYDYVEIYDKNIVLYSGDKKKIDFDYDSLIDPVWTSANPDIATVNQYGKVVARKEGITKITVTCGRHSASVNVTVKKKITYKMIAKKMKKYAKNKKGLTFKNIDVGSQCRLYGYEEYGIVNSVKTDGYYYEFSYGSYIELTQKKGRPNIKLVIFADKKMNAIFEPDICPYKLKIRTNNRKLDYGLYTSQSNYYQRSNGVYYARNKSKAVLSTKSKAKIDKIEKFKKMLGQKSLKLYFDYDEGWTSVKLDKKTCKNWKKLASYYQKILEAFE